MDQFNEEAKEAASGHIHDSITRREFISGSAALIAVTAFGRTARAKTVVNQVGHISNNAFEDARARASALVNQMTPEEVAGQLVNSAPALPRLKLQKYQYWYEALHGVGVDGPVTSFPQPMGARGIPNSSTGFTAPCRMRRGHATTRMATC